MEGNEKRVYVADCGCVRIESRNFRVTLPPERFIEILREIIDRQKTIPPFCTRLTVSNNVSSSGFVSIRKNKIRRL